MSSTRNRDRWDDHETTRRTARICIGGRGLLLLIATTMLATPAQAGGLYVNEFSTTSQANAGAGRGAWAPDASATLHNPASMTRLDDHGFATGFSLAVGNIHFDTEGAGGNGGNQAGPAPIASFSYAHKVSDRVRFGLSFYSISGSVLDPSNDWAGRFQLTGLSLLTISMSPTLAVRLTDWLSIGGGAVVSYGYLDWDLKTTFPGVTENYVRLNDLDDWEASGRVGAVFHPSDDFALSVFYNSKTDFKLDGEINGPIGLTPDLTAELPLAQFVEVSTYWQVTKKLALLATVGWEDWSEANNLGITLGPVSNNATTGFQDTYKIGIGANYQISRDWLLQTGVNYDSSALKNTDRVAALPIDEQWRFAIGAQHDWNDTLNIGLSFVYVNLGQGEIRTATLRGDYDRNHIFVAGLTLAFKELPWAGKATFGSSGS